MPQRLGLELLAGWLRLAAGITRLRRVSSATVAHRTSPSGGARHPTELAVRLGAAWPVDLRGSWWYDSLDHALLPADWPIPQPVSPMPDDVVFAVTSHVERAMWRYRDARAFRPVLIDAGHVVETLMSVLSSVGWTAVWHPSPGFVAVNDNLDPVLGYVVASRHGHDRDLPPSSWYAAATSSWDALRTNPLLSLTATPTTLNAENHLRVDATLAVTPAMVDALAYATPSSRRDRPTSRQDIAAATGVGSTDLDALVAHGLLLDERNGDGLWRLARAWFHHDWFLSLLAHAEEGAGASRAARPGRTAVPPSLDHLPQALNGRRTCRALTGAALPAPEAERALAAAMTAPPDVQVVVVARHDSGDLRRGTYLLERGAWTPLSIPTPTEQEVTAAAIGQPWARGFAMVFWFIPSPQGLPGDWEAALIECGRAAQRLALAVSHNPAIGVFQSPALVDELLADILPGYSSDEGAYLVGIGVAGDAEPDLPRLFRPSEVFAAPGAAPS